MTVKITNSIPLPSKLRKTWRGSRVLLFQGQDSLVVKRVQTVSVQRIREKLRDIGQKITSKDIASAIRAARG